MLEAILASIALYCDNSLRYYYKQSEKQRVMYKVSRFEVEYKSPDPDVGNIIEEEHKSRDPDVDNIIEEEHKSRGPDVGNIIEEEHKSREPDVVNIIEEEHKALEADVDNIIEEELSISSRDEIDNSKIYKQNSISQEQYIILNSLQQKQIIPKEKSLQWWLEQGKDIIPLISCTPEEHAKMLSEAIKEGQDKWFEFKNNILPDLASIPDDQLLLRDNGHHLIYLKNKYLTELESQDQEDNLCDGSVAKKPNIKKYTKQVDKPIVKSIVKSIDPDDHVQSELATDNNPTYTCNSNKVKKKKT